jgi:ankyrin repeat protein
MPLPVGFSESIVAKHVAEQAADYLPQVPNLPQSRTIGRVKPRSAATDWLMISFDPWSAGKNPLGTEFVASLMDKADKILSDAQGRGTEAMDVLRKGVLGDAFFTIEDSEGLVQQRNAVSKSTLLANDFKKLCSMCRHSKFADAEQLINQPDWKVPIDYQDDQGNTLLHVVAQNGNKRMMKLCLRRGAGLNIQNLSGQTPLHFAYGYGYADAGDYLLSKGADDTLRNADGLTCYEGLGAKELSLL